MSNEQLLFAPPSRSTPGYLRRMSKLLNFARASETGEMSADNLKDMVEFLADYVMNEITREEKMEMLWELSEQEFQDLIALVQAGSEVLDDSEGNA